jgi:hypothetical protein
MSLQAAPASTPNSGAVAQKGIDVAEIEIIEGMADAGTAQLPIDGYHDDSGLIDIVSRVFRAMWLAREGGAT